MLALVTQKTVKTVDVTLPIGEIAQFKLKDFKINKTEAFCTTIKDAGDDPDVTHLAEISALVSLNNLGKIVFKRGEGVGLVTLPGLETPVGEPAINPVPRQMMQTVCKKILADYNLEHYGVDITISVKDGEQLAKRTLNSRLGILGGISILGTTGIVTPFSAASYIASIQQGIDVAIANGNTELLINSGGRSEKMLRAIFSKIPETACIHYGNWIQETFEKINNSNQIATVNMGIMLGKAAKLAQGNLNTHSGKTTWDKHFIASLAKQTGYSKYIVNTISTLNMAGRLREIITFAPQEPFYQLLLQKCYEHCKKVAPHITLHLFLINNDGHYIKYQL